MKKTFCFLLLIVLTGNYADSQTIQSSLLWEISGNGLPEPSHIFGSFHILCKDDFSIPDILRNRIKNAKQFYGELDMDDPTLQQQIAMKMILQGKTLQSLMSAEDYTKVSEQFQKIIGISLAMFNNFKPFMGLSLLAINSISCKEKIQPETEFANLAKQYHLPIRGLETVDDEINAIDKEPLDSQINSLKQTVLNYDSVKNMMLEMKAVYNLRDIDSLYRFIKKAGAGGDFETELLIKRNQNWLPVIKKAMAENTAFFVVGAGHLGGQEGVINLLRKQGYKVTPVMY